MKNNLKTKVMLVFLTGGMLCANGAWAAEGDIWWYGTTGGFVDVKPDPAVTTGVNLTITDSTQVNGKTVAGVNKEIYGGYTSGSEDVKNNSITFNTTNVAPTAANIYGADTDSGNASGNSVNIKNGTFSGMIFGGYNFGSTATKNSVVIDGGTFSNTIYGAQGAGVDGNSVTINNGTFNNSIFGGNATNSIAATNNTVTINDGTFGNKMVYGGVSSGGDVTGNKVIINDGQFTGTTIWAGYAMFNPSGNATKNIVTIKGGTFNDIIIYGGSSVTGDATGNTVNIEGGTLNTIKKLYGGYAGTTGTSTNNTLNLNTKLGGTSTEVKYFQTMNFTLPSGIGDGDIMLKTTKMAFDATVINVDAVTGTRFAKDSVITLVSATEEMSGTVTQGTIPNGSKLNLASNAYLTDKKLTLTFTSDYIVPATPEEKAVLEGIAASLAFVNQGADMVAGSGIDGLYVADSENPTIAAFSGNKTRYKTGSHVDIHGWNALAGVALNNKKSFSHGVFVEIGNGDIDTYAAINGSGSSDYKGGGYMLRKELGKGWNLDGAVRAGRVETSWSNNDKGGYEAKQTYYGAHVTFNKMLKEYGEQKLNGYLRYTFTHLGSDNVNLDSTHYGFDSVNSHRTRLGARMAEEGQNGFELYYGAAWEYGFGGDCDATVNGVTTSGPAVDGSNAVFEVGGTWSDKKWDISAGLEGYAGAKRGVAGGMNFVYKF